MARPELLRRDHCNWSSSLVVTASWRKGYSYANGNRRPFFCRGRGCKGNMAPTYSLKCIGILILHVTANGLAASFYDPAGWLNIKIRGQQKCWWNFWIMIVLPPLKHTHIYIIILYIYIYISNYKYIYIYIFKIALCFDVISCDFHCAKTLGVKKGHFL